MKKGNVSILMSVYNCENTIRQCIDSVLSQTYSDWTFIICDDCSTDNTRNILCEYAKQYPNKFVIIKNDQNRKLSYSLNRCLEYAEGEYSARMDGDDYIEANRFERQVEYLAQNKDIQLVGTNMQVFGNGGFGRIVKYKNKPNKFDLRYGPCFAHASIMMYTNVYKDIGGYTVSKRTTRTQDYDLWFRFFYKGYIGENIEEPLYCVREDEKSFLRRKPSLYLWAVVTRWKGFRLLNYPARYYWRVLIPLFALVVNEARKLKVKINKK